MASFLRNNSVFCTLVILLFAYCDSDFIADLNKSPEISVSLSGQELISGSSSIDFGGILAGASKSKTITIKNTGSLKLKFSSSNAFSTGSSEFTLTSLPSSLTLEAGAAVEATIQFSASGMGKKTATLTILSDDKDEGTYSIGLNGVVAVSAAAEINLLDHNSTNLLSGGSFNFGSVVNGADRLRTFTIQNLGLANLTLSGGPLIAVSGGDSALFTVNSLPSSSIAGVASTTFVLKFAPISSGSKTATVSIANSDADENPYSFTVNGMGVAVAAPEINIHQGGTNLADGGGSYDFGTRQVSTTSSPITFTIENTGSTVLNLTSTPRVILSGASSGDFSVTVDAATSVAAAGSTTFNITFSPSATGLRSATVTVANNDSDENPYTFTITGSGQPFNCSVGNFVSDHGGIDIHDTGSNCFVMKSTDENNCRNATLANCQNQTTSVATCSGLGNGWRLPTRTEFDTYVRPNFGTSTPVTTNSFCVAATGVCIFGGANFPAYYFTSTCVAGPQCYALRDGAASTVLTDPTWAGSVRCLKVFTY